MDINAFFKVTYGLYIVSAFDGDKFGGHVSNTVFQITSDPPRFAVASNKKNFTTACIEKNKAFAISVLQQDCTLDFLGPWGFQSGNEVDKFENTDYRVGKTGSPIILDKTIAYLDCEVESTIDTGTHFLFIGKVVDAEVLDSSQPPLSYAYYRDVIKGLSPENAPTYTGEKKEKEIVEKETANLKSAPKKYQCAICGYIYDPEQGDPHTGIEPGTAFEDIPDDWFCPICGVGKKDFMEI